MTKAGFIVVAATVIASVAAAQQTDSAIHIRRAAGPITIDGNISDAGWQNATHVDKWYETNPGDNVEPSVKSVGYLTYDDRFFYAAFEFNDPDPKQIRSPLGDHDQVGGNTDDYGGIILDTRNDKKTAVLLLSNARGIQYDAVTDDASGEDSSPDFYWDAATTITDKGWILEMRVPFSSLRYDNPNPSAWGILLYRNMPRDRRVQMFSNRLPRGGSCFICHRNDLTGLSGLPSGGHLIAAPYVTAKEVGTTREGLGSDFVNRPIGANAGLDVKWTPNGETAVDATLNPDFSQIESDVAAISTNERFAIFFPERRPFFLEGVELFSTPLQAAYTRTITSPRWGLRSTGKRSGTAYTVLVTQDRGGGSVILPGTLGSGLADQDFESLTAIGRVKRDFGKNSFVSFLFTDRENEGSAHNRVLGPDFQWRLGDRHTFTGQLLYSDTQTPVRPDLADEWNGQQLRGHAIEAWYQYSTRTVDYFAEARDVDEEFRADTGFIPQVGFRLAYSELGYTWRPEKQFFNRIRAFGFGEYDSAQSGDLIYRLMSAGVAGDGKLRSFYRLRYARDGVRTGDVVLDRDRLYYTIEVSPSRTFARVSLTGWIGDEIDFSNDRLGRGADVSLTGTIRPNDHVQIGVTTAVRWLNISGDRLFTSQIERLRAQYTFNSRMFVRAIVQNARTNRDVPLYGADVSQHGGNLASQLLFAYKLNWQTVLYFGFGDLREVTSLEGDLEPSERQFFTKVSYAFQR